MQANRTAGSGSNAVPPNPWSLVMRGFQEALESAPEGWEERDRLLRCYQLTQQLADGQPPTRPRPAQRSNVVALRPLASR